jgi:predicted transcriptional regulator
MILEEAGGGATKSKIMYRAFFELRAIEGMPIGLYRNGLLEYIEGRQTLKTTANGLNFFEDNNEIGELLQTTVRRR